MVTEVIQTADQARSLIQAASPHVEQAVASLRGQNLKELISSIPTAEKLCGIAGALGLGYSLYTFSPFSPTSWFSAAVSCVMLKYPLSTFWQGFNDRIPTIDDALPFTKKVDTLEEFLYKYDLKIHKTTLKKFQVAFKSQYSELRGKKKDAVPAEYVSKLNTLGDVIDGVLTPDTAPYRLKMLFHKVVRGATKKVNLRETFYPEAEEVCKYIVKNKKHVVFLQTFDTSVVALINKVLKQGLQSFRPELLDRFNLAFYACMYADQPHLPNIEIIRTALVQKFNELNGHERFAFPDELADALERLEQIGKVDGQAEVIKKPKQKKDLKVPRQPSQPDTKSAPQLHSILKPPGSVGAGQPDRHVSFNRQLGYKTLPRMDSTELLKRKKPTLSGDQQTIQASQPPVSSSTSQTNAGKVPSPTAAAPKKESQTAGKPRPAPLKLDNAEKFRLAKLTFSTATAFATKSGERSPNPPPVPPKTPKTAGSALEAQRRRSISGTDRVATTDKNGKTG